MASPATRAQTAASSGARCDHARLDPGARCPGCQKLQTYLAAKERERVAVASPRSSGLRMRLVEAWAAHPVRAFFAHRRRRARLEGMLQLIRAGAGIPVILENLGRFASAAERERLRTIGARIAEGETLAQALRSVPGFEEESVLALIEAGEAGGKLEVTLERIIGYLDATQALRWSMVKRMPHLAYVLLLYAASGEVGMVTPGGAISLSGPVLRMVVPPLALFLFPLLVALLGLQRPLEAIKIRLPVIGGIVRRLSASRFALVFGLAHGAGLEVKRTLALALAATRNARFTAQTAAAIGQIESGATLSEVFERLHLFDRIELGELHIAEGTGTLEPVMARIAGETSDSALRRTSMLLRALSFGATVIVALVTAARLIAGYGSSFHELDHLGE